MKKQIDELTKHIYSMLRADAMSRAMASMLYGEGYRKASEVAREIFEEVQKYTIMKVVRDGKIVFDCTKQFAELKKKYTEGEG